MKRLFEAIFGSRETNDPTGVRGIHKDFRFREGDLWYFNRDTSFTSRFECKVLVYFDDPTLLDKCPFYAKIGKNGDRRYAQRYVAFFFGGLEQGKELVSWGKRFPNATLIANLDREGASTQDSLFRVIKV